MSYARDTSEFIQIKSDILRWLSDAHGMQAIAHLETKRLDTLIRTLLADGPTTSETVWYLIGMDGYLNKLADIDVPPAINDTLRALVP